jgi:DNA polymerase III subunit epsilon
MKANRPVVFFDLETTGTNTGKDRTVSLYLSKVVDGSVIDTYSALVNPCMAIPKEASDVHHITDEMVKDKPAFKDIAENVYNFLSGCDVAGFNIIAFDVPMLCEEFATCGINWPAPDVAKIDACSIFRLKEARTLTAAMKFYCNEEMEGAHDAGNDVNATIKVFFAQMRQYPDLADLTPEQIESFCTGGVKSLDVAGKIILNKDGVPCYGFGKSINVPVRSDRGFGEWMLKNNFPANTKAVVRKILSGSMF